MTEPGIDPLLEGLAAGREEDFLSLYDRFGGPLYRTALRMLGRPEDAEDAVQEVFSGLVRSRRRLTAVRDLRAYLFASLRRAVGRLAQRREQVVAARAAPVAGVAPPPSGARDAHPGAGVPHRIAAHPRAGVPHCADKAVPQKGAGPADDRLERALAALPPEQREVVALKVEGELTFAQIAQLTGVSINTAASRYRYALEKLRAALEE